MEIKKDLESLNDVEYDVLKEIGNIGAGNATTALSKMMNTRVNMQVPHVDMLEFKDLAEVVGGEETLVVGIMLTLEGDIKGSMMFMLEKKAAAHLVQSLMHMDVDDSDDAGFSDMELSALQEIGNIITGAYLSSISKLTKMTIVPSIPYLSIDMAGAILSVPAIEFGKLGDKALLIESRFDEDEFCVNGYFILIPTLDSYEKILNSLGIS